jgi:GNAT superfamily N-acetyltransferase
VGDIVRSAAVAEAGVVAQLLHEFNREFDTPTPGTDALTARLRDLLAGGDVVALLVGDPPVGVGLVTLRPNVWFDGPVGLLDELYVVPAHRGRAIGSALLAAAEELVRARGGELLEINVDATTSMPAASTSATATATPNPAATSSSPTTTGSWPADLHDAVHGAVGNSVLTGAPAQL